MNFTYVYIFKIKYWVQIQGIHFLSIYFNVLILTFHHGSVRLNFDNTVYVHTTQSVHKYIWSKYISTNCQKIDKLYKKKTPCLNHPQTIWIQINITHLDSNLWNSMRNSFPNSTVIKNQETDIFSISSHYILCPHLDVSGKISKLTPLWEAPGIHKYHFHDTQKTGGKEENVSGR